jgi:hypothetical protein
MYGNDWRLPAGHRLGVLLTGANAEWWSHVPTGQQVKVKSAKLSLPFLGCRRSQRIEGGPSIKLEDYLKNAPFPVDAETVNASTSASFALPPSQANCTAREIAAGGPQAPRCVNRRSLTLPLHHAKGRRIVSVRAYVNGRLVAKRTGRDVKSVTLKGLPAGLFRVKLVTRTNDGHSGRSAHTYRGCGKAGRDPQNDRR